MGPDSKVVKKINPKRKILNKIESGRNSNSKRKTVHRSLERGAVFPNVRFEYSVILQPSFIACSSRKLPVPAAQEVFCLKLE